VASYSDIRSAPVRPSREAIRLFRQILDLRPLAAREEAANPRRAYQGPIESELTATKSALNQALGRFPWQIGVEEACSPAPPDYEDPEEWAQAYALHQALLKAARTVPHR
jgi:hypothetical protein